MKNDLRRALHTPFITTTESAAESMRIEQVEGSHIIIAASGMCEAGRIRHHLKNHLWRANSTVMLVGYQAEGTLGKILGNGAKSVRIQGEEIKVRARIRQIDVYSGHADGPALLRWISERENVSRALLLVHGEEGGMDALESDLLAASYDARKVIKPVLDDVFDLMSEEGDIRKLPIPRRLRPEVVGRMDWHNDLSSLWLDISDALDKAADDRARNVIIRRLRRAFEKTDAD
jgi:metallo-beta-lactamase family protein